MRIGLLGSLTLAAAGLASAALTAQVISVELPAELEPPRGSVDVALVGQGMCMQAVDISTRVTAIDIEKLVQKCGNFHDFRPIREIKMLALVPGTSVESFVGPALESVWRPNLVLLPVVRVEGRLRPAPPIGSTVRFTYDAVEGMRFFGYIDGTPPQILVGSALVGREGEFRFEAPNIAADSFVQDEGGVISVRVQDADGRFPFFAAVPIKKFYEPSLVEIMVENGR